MFKKQLILLLVILCNTSCSLWPTYTKPTASIPHHWLNTTSATIHTTINLPDMHWWKQFHNQELNTFIHQALQHNNQIRIALANIDYVHSQFEQVKFNWYPSLSLLTGYSQMPILGNPGAFYFAIPQYALNIFQQIKQQANAKALWQASVYAKDSVRLTIIADTAMSFFSLLAEQEKQTIYQNLNKNYFSYLKLFKTRYNTGLIAYDRIVEIQSQRDQVQAKLDITQHNIVTIKNGLHYLLDENPGNINIKTSFRKLNMHGFLPETLPLNVLANRPDVQEAEAQLHAANEAIGATSSTLLPALSISNYLGQGSLIKGTVNLSQATLGMPVINLPLYAQIKGSKALYQAALTHYLDTIKRTLRDIENDFSAYHAYGHQYKRQQQAYLHQKKHCQLTSQRHKHGLKSKTTVLQCRIQLAQLELLVNQSKLEYMLIIVRLYRDLAGGYRDI